MDTRLQGDLRESLLGILKDVSPLTGNWLVKNLGSSVATQPLHEWPTFNLARPTSVTLVAEGASAVVADLTAPVKSSNYTGIITEVIQVTGTDRHSVNALGVDPMTFQKEKRLAFLSAKMEYSLVNGGIPSAGASGVARQFAGLDSVISTNLTARASGQSFTTVELEDILQNSWEAVGSGFVANSLLVPMVIKRRISGFTTNITNFANVTDKLFSNVSSYEASTGTTSVVAHKDVNKAAGSLAVFAIRPEMYKMAFLKGREPMFEELASTGDYDLGQYITELTLESLAEATSVKRSGYLITL